MALKCLTRKEIQSDEGGASMGDKELVAALLTVALYLTKPKIEKETEQNHQQVVREYGYILQALRHVQP